MPKPSLVHPRNRIINFRLTDREYDDLRAACATHGDRCLSDFARAAVLTYAQAPAPGDAVRHQLLALDEKLSDLGDRLQFLLDRLALSPTEN